MGARLPILWQNRRRRRAAAVRCITACPPRFSDLVPSLKIVSIEHVAFTQPWLLKGFPGLFSKVHGFPSSYILRRPQKIDKISQLALILVSKHHINWENIFLWSFRNIYECQIACSSRKYFTPIVLPPCRKPFVRITFRIQFISHLPILDTTAFVVCMDVCSKVG